MFGWGKEFKRVRYASPGFRDFGLQEAEIHMKTIRIFDRAGAFAENKDVARDIRINEIVSALNNDEEVTLDFHGVDAAT